MFEKLLSMLPYNPGLAHQLAFYSKRMREEAAIRRTGMVFMILAFMIQFFAVLSPPQPTAAYSINDLVNGGISSAGDGAQKCRSNVRNYGDIMHYYGIDCSDIAHATNVSLGPGQYDKGYFSMGHNPQGAHNARTGRATHEVPVNIPSAGTLYFRLLSSFDSGPGVPAYHALRLKNSAGATFYILYGCGNLVSIGVPHPVTQPKPVVQPKPSASGTGFIECKYNKNIPDTSPKCVAPCQYNKNLPANSPKCFKPCQYNKTIPANSPQCFQPCKYNKNLPANSAQCFDHCTLPGKTNLPKNSPQCANAPCQYNSKLPPNSPQCFQPCQYKPSVSIDSPECVAPCQYNTSLPADSEQCFQPCQYNSTLPAESQNCFQPCSYNHSIPTGSPQCYEACKYNSSIPSTDVNCKPCDKTSGDQNSIACVDVHKTASNVTTGTTDANNTTAQPGDVISYTLYAQNSGKDTVKGFTFQENLADVLDYADATDLHGGTMDDSKLVSWPAQDIAAGQTASQQVTIKVKDTIPQTPGDPADPAHFDLIMTNVYGNTININVPGSPGKTVEAVATTLPNTGPGTSLFLAACTVMFAGYFYARARLLAKESSLAVQELASA